MRNTVLVVLVVLVVLQAHRPPAPLLGLLVGLLGCAGCASGASASGASGWLVGWLAGWLSQIGLPERLPQASGLPQHNQHNVSLPRAASETDALLHHKQAKIV